MDGTETEKQESWEKDMALIEGMARNVIKDKNYTTDIPIFLGRVRRIVGRWGGVPDWYEEKTNDIEDIWAGEGNFIQPIFRDSFPKLVYAHCESIHANNIANTWRHCYKTVSGEIITGAGVPKTKKELKNAEITYFQLDGTGFTVSRQSVREGLDWKKWIQSFWHNLYHIRFIHQEEVKRAAYNAALEDATCLMETEGEEYFPPNVCRAIQELKLLKASYPYWEGKPSNITFGESIKQKKY